ncbi:MAG TPA: GGDEF domain-containing protein [Burkholderiaceae bacterium]|jgi:diguanylate cyclase (GGDEF)-like protein|nr:GGDEF domain-containing protein [Burkholderiaceae bacterium]
MTRATGARRNSDRMPHEEWDSLCANVAGRLRGSAEHPAAAPVREELIACAQDLEVLRAALLQEQGHLSRIEAELNEARATLAVAHARERDAQYMAQHDSLTDLPNRRHFCRRLDDALSTAPTRPPTMAVLFLDLDDFKPINDAHGHETGDELLRIVAQRLRRMVRDGDIVCRLGGDEFACLLSQPRDRAELSRLARQLLEAIAAPLQLGGIEIRVWPSIGIAVCPNDGDTAITLLRRADAAMYRAKRGRLGYAFFDSRSDVTASETGGLH